MSEIKAVEVKYHKGKLLLLLTYAIIFIVTGMWLLNFQPDLGDSILSSPIVKSIIGVITILMGLFGCYTIAKRMFSKGPAILIDADGITNYTSAVSYGTIKWDDILEIKETTIRASLFSKHHFVSIIVRNPEEYRSNIQNVFAQKVSLLNRFTDGSLLSITANGLDVKHKDLLTLLNEKFTEYQIANLK
jgi:hypothetical protein